MERLTAHSVRGLKLKKGKKFVELFSDKQLTLNALNHLAEFEDKIENGRLVEQPCKVGDTVWLVKYLTCEGMPSIEVFDEWIIERIVTTKHGTVFVGTHEGTEDFRPFGDDEYKVNWFTDKAEAEAKLKELKGRR